MRSRLSTAILLLCVGAIQALSNAGGQKKSQAQLSQKQQPTSVAVQPTTGGGASGKVRTQDNQVTKTVDQSSPPLGRRAGTVDQTVKVGSSRTEVVGDQTTTVGGSRTETVNGSTIHPGGRSGGKTKTITTSTNTPSSAVQTNSSTAKKKKPAASPHKP